MNANDLLDGINNVEFDLVCKAGAAEPADRKMKMDPWRRLAANRQFAGGVLAAVFVAVLVLTIVLSSGRGASDLNAPGQNNELSVRSGIDVNDWYEQEMERQKHAVAAYAALTYSFEMDPQGNYVYPDSFCGAWIEDEYLVIALKSPDAAVKQRYEKVLIEYEKYVRYVERKYAKNELYDLIEKVSAEIRQTYGEPIQSYSLREQENRVEIGVPEELLARLREDGYVDRYAPVIRFTAGDTVNTRVSLKGGMAITNTNASISMTLSACGYYGGNNAIITCGHGGQAWLDPIQYGGSLIGYIESKQYSDYGYGDYSIIPASTGNHSISAKILSYTVTGWYNSLAVNTIVKFYGYATGSIGWGQVKDTGAMVYTNDHIHIKGVHKVDIDHGSVTNGDSGGPFFVTTSSSTASYCGVLCGDYITEESQWIVVFTPCQYLSGFAVKYEH